MVVAAGGDEGGGAADALLQLEAEHATVKLERAFEVGHFQMNVTDADAGIDRPGGGRTVGHATILPMQHPG
jgi:hypothetical protein